MSKLQKHLNCPQASHYLTRLKVGQPVPAGDIKTIYARINRKWVRVGWLCLDCKRFQPQHKAPKIGKERGCV